MTVMSLRLGAQEAKRIDEIARKEEKEKSKVARELIEEGLKYKALVSYKNGSLSLAGLAHALNLSLSEVIDYLADFGIESPITYDDFLEGLDNARKLF